MAESTSRMKHDMLLKLHAVSFGLNSEVVDARRLFDYIVKSAMELTKAVRGFLVLVGTDTRELTVQSAINTGTKTPQEALEMLSKGMVQEAVRTGQPVIVQNASGDKDLSRRDSVTRLRLQSVAVVPLRVDTRIVGVLYIDNPRTASLFGPNERVILEIFANQAALALRRLADAKKL